MLFELQDEFASAGAIQVAHPASHVLPTGEPVTTGGGGSSGAAPEPGPDIAGEDGCGGRTPGLASLAAVVLLRRRRRAH